MIFVLGALLILMALLGTPLFVVLAGLALVSFVMADTNIIVLSEEHYKLATNPHLLTIPMFTLAGFLMAESKAAERLVRVSRALLGGAPGGLAIVVVASCAFFTTFTGASGVTIIALGGLLYPILLEERYPEDFSLGLITASGSIGLLFPPSLPIILYGIVAGASIDDLFIAGIFPGAVMMGVLALYCVWVGLRREPDMMEGIKGSWKELVGTLLLFPLFLIYKLATDREVRASIWEAKWELAVPVVVVGAIYGLPDFMEPWVGAGGVAGLVTIAEASVVCAAYLLIIEVFVFKDISLFDAPEGDGRSSLSSVIRESMVMVGAILIILGAALGLTNYLIQEEVPMQLLAFIQEHIESRTTFLFMLTIFLLIVGCLMDIFSAILVVVPLITPIAAQYGVDPIHLGIIFLANLEIGYITPPVGLNLFISSLAFDKPVVKLYRMAIPFLILLLMALMLITFYPPLSLWFMD